ncbi:hypothetical protein ACFLIM_11825 [Nonomuraea sp. M3C6]|uniref:Uncharacterized protein n=1 Tax=Nonomuraea marmarensis TaxID=3351344 RepID=A0ABW7A951_9ACTN
MVAIGFALLGVGLVVGVLLALADPVMLSRVNGEPAEGGSGRFVEAGVLRLPPRYDTESVRLPPRSGGDRHEPKAA